MRTWTSALLAAALLLGQALAAAHDSDHGSQDAAHGCVVCVYAHGAGHGALPVAPELVFGARGESPHPAPASTEIALAVRLHPIRGPPAVLA